METEKAGTTYACLPSDHPRRRASRDKPGRRRSMRSWATSLKSCKRTILDRHCTATPPPYLPAICLPCTISLFFGVISPTDLPTSEVRWNGRRRWCWWLVDGAVCVCVCVGVGGYPSLTGFSRSLSGREMCIHTGVTFLNKC